MKIPHCCLCGLLLPALLVACGAETTDIGALSQPAVENRGNETEAWWDKLPRPQWAAFEKISTDQTWFDVYKIREHIYALHEPGQFEEVISFLIIGNDRALLFDTGLGIGDIKAVVAALTSKPLLVLNSHSHYDHVGGNYQFTRLLGRDTPFGRKRARGTAHQDVAEFVSPAWIWKPLPPGFKPETYHIKPYTVTQWVEEGQFIDLGGTSLEIIDTPGHAPDCISLIDHNKRLLFTGDAFYLAPLYAHLEGGNLRDYRASAAKMAALSAGIDTLITSHNVPTAPGEYLQAMDQAFAAILNGEAEYTSSDGAREYTFDGFSVLTSDPP
jgi:glyoxylase-like metal-dependent hydrolase (beta-lactamase superfamily II)